MKPTTPSESGPKRFTLDGSRELEARLHAVCEQVRQAVLWVVPPPKLEALVLGGGYGRGQGGVLKTENGDEPYNDLEFYVFIRGNLLLNEVAYRSRLHRLGEALSPGAGLHVEFKVDSLKRLRQRPVSIFSYDLVAGHQDIYARRSPFGGCEKHLDSTRIDSLEATRLLVNRCSGLLLVQELLNSNSLTPDESDFIGRNLAKAQLAMGDAMLTAEGQYHWDCLERAKRLPRVHSTTATRILPQVLKHHAEGVRFKLHPTRSSKATDGFKTEHREISELAMCVWLLIENHRLSVNFSSLREYAFSPLGKCAGERLWRNVLLNIRMFGAGAALDRNSPRYPRERLFNALPLLLGNDSAADQLDTRRHLQRQLRTCAQDWRGLVAAYKQVWSCYG
jgi:hypothetical protein